MTPYDEIIDLALVSIEDYRINRLAQLVDEANFEVISSSNTYLEYVEIGRAHV